ncbi:tyrosine-type recombinase/integrase [Hahella aquimaris]|uniref:tyrosine-type recombinase/integrase n=1 Tax=Hahella sp. HNIBRBA332 TaxID=3015983 RepID=UPI00273C72B1|nr:tyrosine-type recombinase/integrase [Hahella sp. HNIBRBA332]WLQ16811.1 tyrosine-type recombinase/integrase [Hahella sp. HNIBRBA332]
MKTISVAGCSSTYLRDINWEQAISRRPKLLDEEEDLPKYLLLPEVQRVLAEALNDHLNLFLDTLWHTGAKVGEALALTPSSFHLSGDSDVLLRSAGKLGKSDNVSVERFVPLTDADYLQKVRRYIVTNKVRPQEPLFRYSVRYYRKLLDQLILGLGTAIAVPVTLQTFRHSFAVNLVLHGLDIQRVQKLLGIAHIKNTVVYAKVLSGDLHSQMKDVRFHL